MTCDYKEWEAKYAPLHKSKHWQYVMYMHVNYNSFKRIIYDSLAM